MGRRKSLLIGINYTGSQHALRGCINDAKNMSQFLASRGFPTDPNSMVFLTDDRQGPFYASGRNILAAMDWLVKDPECSLFLHYSGHGGQVRDPDGDRDSGFDDTIVPVDFEKNGQIDSDTLHRHLVSALPRNCTLHIIFDCCHSGSAVELPFVYRTDDDGNINLVDSLKQGASLVGQAQHLLQGGFNANSLGEAKQLLGGATSFFRGLKHQFGQGDAPQEDGLQEEHFQEDWSREGKTVFMFSGCKDEQTSADANIAGNAVGAMSHMFLQVMRSPQAWNMSYIEILQQTRALLKQNYQQIPQLSCGYQFDLTRKVDELQLSHFLS